MGQRHVCTFRLAQRAAYRTAISAAQTCFHWGKQDQILKTKTKTRITRPRPSPPEVNKGTDLSFKKVSAAVDIHSSDVPSTE